MRRPPTDRGQATVEFALALPLVAVMVLGVLQIIVVARDQLAVEVAAREAARAAAVSGTPEAAAARAAEAATSLRPLDVAVTIDGNRVTARITYTAATDVPLVGLAIADVDLEASVTMLREPP